MFADWQHYSTQPCETLQMSGNHVTMMRQPHVQKLANAIRAVLSKQV